MLQDIILGTWTCSRNIPKLRKLFNSLGQALQVSGSNFLSKGKVPGETVLTNFAL